MRVTRRPSEGRSAAEPMSEGSVLTLLTLIHHSKKKQTKIIGAGWTRQCPSITRPRGLLK